MFSRFSFLSLLGYPAPEGFGAEQAVEVPGRSSGAASRCSVLPRHQRQDAEGAREARSCTTEGVGACMLSGTQGARLWTL